MVKSNIDSFRIIENGDTFLIYISGWRITDKKTDIKCKINGMSQSIDINWLLREDVNQLFNLSGNTKNGFEITIKWPKDKDLIQLSIYIQSWLKKDIILKLNAHELHNYCQLSLEPIYCIDRLLGDENNYYVEGFAFQGMNQCENVKIIDENERIVPIKMTRKSRTDVVHHYHLSKENYLLGFEINFNGDPDKEYYLVINNKKIPLIYKNQNKKLSHAPMDQYHIWYQLHKPTVLELRKQRKTKFSYCPKVSIIVAAYNTNIHFFKEMIDSVIQQTYSNWELCIADGSNNERLENIIKDFYNDPRIKYKKLSDNFGISQNMNAAIEMATGEFIGFFDHDDLLTENALYEVVQTLQNQDAMLIYSDEDKIVGNSGYLKDPHFKPDFNIDLIRSQNYICHFLVMKASLVKELNGFNSKYDGAQDFDFVLRAIEKIKHNNIIHIPKVLYHWRMHENSTSFNPESKLYAFDAGKKAIEDHLARVGYKADVEIGRSLGIYNVHYKVENDPLISIIIPNSDHIDDLDRAIKSLIYNSEYKNFELIIIENNSKDNATFKGYQDLEETDNRIRVINWNGPFNYAAINNYAVEYADGEYLLFLNNDTELLSPNSLSDMIGYCSLPYVGAVGARLVYEDGSIQHAGVVMGLGGIANHSFMTCDGDSGGYFNRVFTTYDVSAVTAACMMIKKSLFNQIGGFDEEFAVAYNDMDLCMKIRQAGKEIVYVPFSYFYHYESKSRGKEDTDEKKQRFEKETQRFLHKWSSMIADDPYYNPNFSNIYPGGYQLKYWDVYELKRKVN